MDTQVNYEPLAETFTGRGSQRGWEFKQLRREGRIALYEKESEGWKCYEVIRVKEDKGGLHKLGGVEVMFEPKERYPSDEDFGNNGWTYGNEGEAIRKYEALVEEEWLKVWSDALMP